MAIRRSPLLALAMTLALVMARPAWAQRVVFDPQTTDHDVLQWNTQALRAIRQSSLAPPVVSRALAILHTCMFDGWAAYHDGAVGTQWGEAGRRPVAERTPEARRRALNEAAYKAFVDVFPAHRRLAEEQMARMGLAPNAHVPHQEPAGVGRAACEAVLRMRHADGSNQLGDENDGPPYSDYTSYRPVNTWQQVRDPDRWQPVHSTTLAVPRFLAPHWGRVAPFAFDLASDRPPDPPSVESPEFRRQLREVVTLSAGLTDRDKATVEYWMDGPHSETPPGHWNLIAQGVSRRDQRSLDEDVQLFFVLNNALMDAGIAAWHCKREFDFVRPITAVRAFYAGTTIRAWAGPGRGSRDIDGASWRPYQQARLVTPSFPEYVSGHSTFSAAAAEVLRRLTGSDALGAEHTIAAGSSRIEPRLVPATPVTLVWATFSDAADQAGFSRRLGGIHFESGDLEGRTLGRAVGTAVWARAQRYLRLASRSTRGDASVPATASGR
jgi:hypothetical protein